MQNLPKAVWVGLTIAIVLAATAFFIGPPPDNEPRTSDQAVADSQATTINVNDPLHDRPFVVSVWQPTPESDARQLVIVSHGFSGDRTSHSDMSQQLVALGYTVAAPTHPDIAGLESGDARLDPLTLRPRHLSLTIDALELEADGGFESVTVVGHSLGGYAGLRLAGAEPVVGTQIESHCDVADDHLLCSDASLARFKTLAASGTSFADARVDRVVLLAPGYGPLFDTPSVDLETDVMVITASTDRELPAEQVEKLAARLNVDVQPVDGGHYVFLRPCTSAEADSVPEICADAPGVDRDEVHRALVEAIDEFVRAS